MFNFTMLTLNILILFIFISDTSCLFEKDFNEYLSKGILFHENAEILLAEKFVNVEFLIPFRRYNFTAKEAIEKTLQKLSNIWKIQSVFCPLDFSAHFNTSTE